MRIDEWLRSAQAALVDTSSTPRLDAEVLLTHVLVQDKAWVLAHPEHTLEVEVLIRLNSLLTRRRAHEPIVYIVGSVEFYGRRIFVDSHVLCPRPESEDCIALALQYTPHTKNLAIADVGSGSGVLGVTLALEKAGSHTDFYDIDPTTLLVAQKNATNYGIDANFYESNLLEDSTVVYDVVLANLPYVPDSYELNSSAKKEPALAIFGGGDGLDLYRKLFQQLDINSDSVYPLVVTESLDLQHSTLAQIAQAHGYQCLEAKGLAQIFKR